MSSIDQPFSVLDESVLAAMEVRHQPYDYAFVENVMPARLKEEILADAPVIPHRGTYGIPNLRYGPKFDAVIKDLLNPRFRKLVEQKFGVDLSKGHSTIDMMGSTTGTTTRATPTPTRSTSCSPSCSGSRASILTNAAVCGSFAATTAMTTPSNTRPSTARCVCSRFPTNPGTASCRKRASE
jgi:hypothetical protein